MAVLTREQVFTELWSTLYQLGQGKELIKIDGLPSRSEIIAIFQALEDWYEGEQVVVKGLVNTAAGRTLSNATIKKLARAYLGWKRRQL